MVVNNMNWETVKMYSITIKGYLPVQEGEGEPETWDINKLIEALEAVTIKEVQPINGMVLDIE